MDKLMSPPCKKTRISIDPYKETQCIREFKLVQQYPSKIFKTQNLQIPKIKKNNVTNVRKLRLKLPNGKDLGEFNVRVLTEEDLGNKQSLFKNSTKVTHFMDTSHEKGILQSMKSSNLKNQRNAVVLPKSLYLNKLCHKNEVFKTNASNNEEEKTLSLSDGSTNNRKCLKQQECNILKDTGNSNVLDIQNRSNNNYPRNKTDVSENHWKTNNTHKTMKDNIMVVVPDNIVSLFCNKEEMNKSNNNVNDKQIHIPMVEVSKNNSLKENNSHKSLNTNEWSQVINVLGQALNSVQDEDLRDKALKALIDCGIGVERKVPAQPQIRTNRIRDSKVQTEMYSLLSPGSFIVVKEDVPGIERIKTNEQSSFSNVTNKSPNEIVDINPNHLSYDMLDNEKASFELGLDLVMNRICEENIGASQIKEAISQTNPLFNKISSQLHKDFERVKKWDENGMLPIHKAVMNEQTHDIRRHLLILKACKENVDIPTQSGMTSLDLAIEHNVSSDIVKLLLHAGADPASPRSIDNCALLIASRLQSKLVPELVKHVKQSKLLNRVDSTGFTALHYCALHDNIAGAVALISAGADVNLRDNRSGRTAIFIAIENDHYNMARVLYDYGASLDIPNFAGHTVRSLVDDVKSVSIKGLLHRTAVR